MPVSRQLECHRRWNTDRDGRQARGFCRPQTKEQGARDAQNFPKGELGIFAYRRLAHPQQLRCRPALPRDHASSCQACISERSCVCRRRLRLSSWYPINCAERDENRRTGQNTNPDPAAGRLSMDGILSMPWLEVQRKKALEKFGFEHVAQARPQGQKPQRSRSGEHFVLPRPIVSDERPCWQPLGCARGDDHDSELFPEAVLSHFCTPTPKKLSLSEAWYTNIILPKKDGYPGLLVARWLLSLGATHHLGSYETQSYYFGLRKQNPEWNQKKTNGRHLLEKLVIRAEELGSCIMRQHFREMAANQLN